MSKVKNENYITIQGFMVNEMKLKGNELLIYAIIYGFSQAETQTFNGSLQYLADWTNSTKQGVIKNLKSLVSKGYIGKNESMLNGIKFVEYYATEFNGVLNKVEQGIKQSLTGGIKQSLPNNININNINKNISIKKFIPPTIDEVKAYCKERNNHIDAEHFIDYYSANGWVQGKNKPIKDWKATIRTWERNGFSKSQNNVGANGIKLSNEKDNTLDGIL